MSTEQATNESIRELTNATGPCITLALAGDEAGDTAIELKEAIIALRKELQDREVAFEELVAPIAAAVAGRPGDTKTRGGIVIFRSPSVMKVYRGVSVKPLLKVNDRFDLRTLLSVRAAQKNFYILALSQNRTRILKCTQDGYEEIPFPAGFADNLADFMQTRKPDHTLDNRVSGGPSMGGGAVMFGTSSDREDKDEHMLHFFNGLDRAVNTALKGSTDPLIPVGVEHELALYRRVNTYAGLLEPGVHGAPDGFEGGELHKRALAALEERASEKDSEAPADFDKRVGTGHASTHVADIVTAAFEGRVSHLFFQSTVQYSGTYDPVRQRIKHTEDPTDSPIDLIEAAAFQTIRQGGVAKILPASAMPNGVPVCALFRYPAVEAAS
jgi:hypothetical protein